MHRWIPGLVASLLLTSTACAGDFTVLNREHADVLIVDRPGMEPRLGIVLRDGDSGALLDPASAILEVGEGGRLEIPPGLEVFGPVGSYLWALPQSQDPALLYLGMSAAGLATGSWQPQFQVELLGVAGPGHFFAWQFDPFSGLQMRMNSRDGIGPDDVLSPLAGAHEHLNWGFSAAGWHQVQMRVSGRLAGSTNLVSSPPVTLQFGVVPYAPPANGATLSLPRWEANRFTCRLSGSPGRSYRIEASGDLRTWTPVTTSATDGSGNADVTLESPAPTSFLRAVALP